VSGGGGPFAICDVNKPCRIDSTAPKVQGHSSAVLDFDWNPFDDSMIASASDDSTVKLWQIPEGGLTSNLTEPLVDMRGHGRKVSGLVPQDVQISIKCQCTQT